MTNATIKQPPRGFDDAEYARRVARLQAAMGVHGWDVVLLTSAADICYICGFLTPFFLSPTRPWFVVVPAQGMPVAVVPQIGAAAMRGCFVGEVREWLSPQPADEGVSVLADTIDGLTKTNGIIGTAMGAETFMRMPVADYDKLRAMLHPRCFVDSADVLWDLRMQKSAAEVDKIRYAASLMSDAFFALSQKPAGAGMSARGVCRVLETDVLRGGVDGVPYLVAASGDGGYETIIMPPACDVINDGEILMIDVGAVYDGYFCDFCRNYIVGKTPPTLKTINAHSVLYDALLAGFDVARPGKVAADVWKVMDDVLSCAGFANDGGGRLGHGIGLQLTEKPSLMKNDNTLLKVGMTLALEPSVTMENGLSVVREENIVIGENKNEWLTKPAPREMLALQP